jgi:hypothetical protein
VKILCRPIAVGQTRHDRRQHHDVRHAAIVHAAGDGVGHAVARTVKVIGHDVLWEQGEESSRVVDDVCNECTVLEPSDSNSSSTLRPLDTARFIAHDDRHRFLSG